MVVSFCCKIVDGFWRWMMEMMETDWRVCRGLMTSSEVRPGISSEYLFSVCDRDEEIDVRIGALHEVTSGLVPSRWRNLVGCRCWWCRPLLCRHC